MAIQFVPLSALSGDGIEDLLEMIGLVAEVQELKANPEKRAVGTVIEAELDKSRGPAASLQNGTLNVGDSIVVGNTYGRIRAMVNDLVNVLNQLAHLRRSKLLVSMMCHLRVIVSLYLVMKNKHAVLVKHVMKQV